MMKNRKKHFFLLLLVLVLFCSGCSSFDPDNYVKAVLDNSIKGESRNLAAYSNASEEDIHSLYEKSVQANLDSILYGVSISENLQSEYRSFIEEMLSKTKYEVGKAEKNSDGSYSVPVTTYSLILQAKDSIDEKTNSYVTTLQTANANGETLPEQEEIIEQTYQITLDCLKEALENATYDDSQTADVKVSIQNRLYTPDQNDLQKITEKLIVLY